MDDRYEHDWGYLNHLDDYLFGSGQKTRASFYKQDFRGKPDNGSHVLEADFRQVIVCDYLFAMDRYTGAVRLEAVVLPDGKVGEVKVLDCTRPKVGFEEAAVAAVKKWRFEPGRVGDVPAEVTLRFRLNFVPGAVSLASETIPGGTAPASGAGSPTTFK